MASDLNMVCLVGRIVKDPELKMTIGGYKYLPISVAFSTAHKTEDGKWENESNFVDTTIRGQRAEALLPFLKKGQQIAINGRLKQEHWQDATGKAFSKLALVTDNIQLVGSVVNPQQSAAPQQPQQQITRPSQVSGPELYNDDSIPF